MSSFSRPFEHQRGLSNWHASSALSPEKQSLMDLFEAHVVRTPHALAVVADGQQLTYQALNKRANQLAHVLQQRGIGSESLVGLCFPCSVDFIVALLATLKAGGTYLPLDPAYPPERLALMLEDARPAILLAHSAFRLNGPATTVPTILLNQEQALFKTPLTRFPLRATPLEQLAYVIYTSGSTGVPKGVCCGHQGVVNLLLDFERLSPLAADARCSLWTSVSFDVSVYEIFSALLFGRSLYLVPEDIRADGPQFVRWLSTHEITSAYMPPFQLADLAFWLQSQPAEPLPLRRLLVGVEPINELLLATIQHHLPDLQIINGYGPTEATVCATLHPVSSQQAQNRNTPLGQPVQNMQVYLLNECLDQVAPGETGEVYIGGPGLARGYLNRPDLTAERFIPNPFSTTPGARLYQTGDLARRLPDGTLAFVGRADQQVKIRGFRIELGEIEEILQQHPAVQRSAVVLRKERPDTSRLVGYITPNPGCTPDPHELQRFLTTKLPLHMVPALLMVIKQMPLLPNGKCDRNALPAPEAICPPVERVLTAPQDALEQRIAAMWASVLHVEQVGRDDDFLKLGGDSLAAMQIRSRLQSAFHVEIPFESILFSFSTVASLAEQIRQL